MRNIFRAYSGASSSQEFYCRYLINKGENVYCVNWSRWKDIGLNKGDEMGAEASKVMVLMKLVLKMVFFI